MSIKEKDNEFNQEVVEYLLNNYTYLMDVHESAAWRNFMLDDKLQVYQPTSQEYISRLQSLKIITPEIKKLMENGLQEFKQQWVKRVLEREADKIVLNRCRKCGGLARTSYAKQCRFSNYQWHKE